MSSEAVHSLIGLSVSFSILTIFAVSALLQTVFEKKKYRVINGLVITASFIGFLLSIFFLVFSSPGQPAELENLSYGVSKPVKLQSDN